MNRLRLLVSDTRLRLEKSAQSVEKCVNFDEAEFVFDATWDGFDKLAVFWRGDEAYQIPLVDTNVCLIPWELMKTKGTIQIGCIGTKPDGTIVTTKTPVAQAVAAGAYRDGIAPKEPTPSVYAKLSGIVSDYVKQIDEVYEAYRSGALNGKDGRDGTNGKDGYTPVKGEDYFTDEDKNELVSEVIAEIPTAESNVFIATYEETPFAEIKEAFLAKKMLFLKMATLIFSFENYMGVAATFTRVLVSSPSTICVVTVRSNDTWNTETFPLADYDHTHTFDSIVTDADKAKLVADVMAALPVYNGEAVVE